MTKFIFCYLLICVCFAYYALGKPVKPLIAKNVRDGCACENFTCSCCANVAIPQISLNDSICLNFGYEPKTYGVSFILNADDKVLINETISATNPRICFAFPFVKQLGSVCIHFYDLSISNKKFYGCAQLELRMWKLYVIGEYNLGCFDAENIRSQQLKILKFLTKSKGMNTTENGNVIMSATVHPNTLQ